MFPPEYSGGPVITTQETRHEVAPRGRKRNASCSVISACDHVTASRRRNSNLVEDPLSDLAFADFTPLPSWMPDELIEMFDSHSYGTEPDLRLAVANFL